MYSYSNSQCLAPHALMYMCMHLWHMAHTPRQRLVMASGHALKRCSFAVAVCELHTGVWGGQMLRALACDSKQNHINRQLFTLTISFFFANTHTTHNASTA